MEGEAEKTRTGFHSDKASESNSRSSRSRFGYLLLMCIAASTLMVITRRDSPPIVAPPLQVGSRVPSISNSTAAAARGLVGDKKSDVEVIRKDHSSKDVTIRVNVTPGGESELKLAVDGPFEIRLADSSKQRIQKSLLSTVRVVSSAKGLRVGDHQFEETQLEIVPQKSPSIRVNGHLYRGNVRLHRRTDGRVSAVNVVLLDDYLASVVDSEMPASFPDEARRAQAIVARTYALYQKHNANPASVYDLFSSQRSQRYLGVEYTDESGRRLAGESDSSRRAVAGTRGLSCKDHGKLFCTYYSACCGGRTTDGSEIFEDSSRLLTSVECRNCRDSKFHRWSKTIPKSDFLAKLKTPASFVRLTGVKRLTGHEDGRISRFRLFDGSKSFEIDGIALRERLPSGFLFSPHFEMVIEREVVRMNGRGHGHGVGMCQWGAAGMARDGATCDEILRHYYPGVEVTGD